jgi:hypothetical protein
MTEQFTDRKADKYISQTINGSNGEFDVTWSGRPGKCRDCGEPVGFGKTKRGRWILFNIPEVEGEIADVHWASCDGKDNA